MNLTVEISADFSTGRGRSRWSRFPAMSLHTTQPAQVWQLRFTKYLFDQLCKEQVLFNVFQFCRNYVKCGRTGSLYLTILN